MSILVLEDSSKVGFGGGQRVTLEVCDLLKAKGEKLWILDQTDESLFYEIASKNHRIDCTFKRARKIDGKSSSSNLFRALIELFDIVKLIKGYKAYALEICPKQIYSTTRFNLVIGIILSMYFGCRHVHHFHSAEPNFFYRKVLRILLKRVDVVIVPSNFVSGHFGLKNIVVVPNFVRSSISKVNNLRTKKVSRNDQVVRIAFIGAFLPYKGSNEFLELYKTCVDERNFQFEFCIIGKDPLNIAGEIPVFWANEMDAALKDVDVAIFMSQAPESFGIAALEAAVAGCVVLYRPLGALPEVIGDFPNCVAVSSGSALEMRNLILEILELKPVYDLAGFDEKFSRNNFKKSINRVFEF